MKKQAIEAAVAEFRRQRDVLTGMAEPLEMIDSELARIGNEHPELARALGLEPDSARTAIREVREVVNAFDVAVPKLERLLSRLP